MRKSVFTMLRIIVLACALAFAPTVPANAASTYTVTFRPGDIGEGFTQGLIDSYKAQYGNVEVTDNGAVRITVPKDSDLPHMPQANHVVMKEAYAGKYFVSGFNGREVEKVTKNVDFVVDYGKLINGVEYSVSFVDVESGEAVAPMVIVYANIGDSVAYTAPSAINTNQYGQYRLVSAARQGITLTENAGRNAIVFNYTNSYDPGSVANDVFVDVSGMDGALAATGTAGTTGTATAAGGVADDGTTAGGTTGGGATADSAMPTGGTAADGTATGGGTADGATGGTTPDGTAADDAAGIDPTQLDDQNPALAGQEGDNIDPNATPLADLFDSLPGSPLLWWGLILAVALGGAALLFIVYKKKKEKEQVEEAKEEDGTTQC